MGVTRRSWLPGLPARRGIAALAIGLTGVSALAGPGAAPGLAPEPDAAVAAPAGSAGCHDAGRSRGQWRLRLDNDLFGHQDQGYSSGLTLDWMSRPAASWSDACVPRFVRQIGGWLRGLRPDGGAASTHLYIGQGLFTPASRRRREIVPDDRPYAAVALAGIGFSARQGVVYRRSDLQIGVVGPAALGELSQDLVHGLLGMDRFHGWRNQLRNEPIVQWSHLRLQHWYRTPGMDIAGGFGIRLGNFVTDLTGSVEWRFGPALPEAPGSMPVRAGTGMSAPSGWASQDGMRLFGFLTIAGRHVARDLTLDGNSFRNSHRVDRHRGMAEIGYGVVLARGEWTLVFGRFHRSREFRGQRVHPVYGSIALSRAF